MNLRRFVQILLGVYLCFFAAFLALFYLAAALPDVAPLPSTDVIPSFDSPGVLWAMQHNCYLSDGGWFVNNDFKHPLTAKYTPPIDPHARLQMPSLTLHDCTVQLKP